jgi:hypothetical protein
MSVLLPVVLTTGSLAASAYAHRHPAAVESSSRPTAHASPRGPAAPTAPTAPTDGPLPLPELAECSSTTHPILPSKWQATALMQGFVSDSLVLGRLVHDEDANAFRFTLADQEGLGLDLMATRRGELFLLSGGDALPTRCELVSSSTIFTVPDRDWLDNSQCVGTAPVLSRTQEWWKTSDELGADWIWFDAASRLPFRTMYYADPEQPAPIYEHFTFSYFPEFQNLDSTNLEELVELCRGSDPIPGAPSIDVSTLESMLRARTPVAIDAGWHAGSQGWIPGLGACEADDSLPPPWPEQVEAVTLMTAVADDVDPLPTRVYYDWTQSAQSTSLYSLASSDDPTRVALLTGNTGYSYEQHADGTTTTCDQSLPGPQVPNWKTVDGCECRAQIAPHTTLNPTDVPTKVLWCPTDLSAGQVFWTWYSDSGAPIVFMQSNSSPTDGAGLNLADYYGWSPGSTAPEGTFDVPAACEGTPKIDVPMACRNCHS